MDTEQKVLTVEELAAVTAKITEIDRQMTHLTTLTPEQRSERRNRVKTKVLHLLPNRVEVARQNRKMLPATFDLSKLELDAALTAALDRLSTALNTIQEHVYDSFLTVGNEAVVSAAAAEAHCKVASATAQRLKPTRHARKSRASTASAAPVIVGAPAPTAGSAVTVSLPDAPTTKAA